MIYSESYKSEYEALKHNIINCIWFHIKDEEDHNDAILNMMERPGIPAIVTQTFDEQESETIDELVIEGGHIIARASCSGYEHETDYLLSEFEVPMLLEILDSVEKRIDLEFNKSKEDDDEDPGDRDERIRESYQ